VVAEKCLDFVSYYYSLRKNRVKKKNSKTVQEDLTLKSIESIVVLTVEEEKS
jgi:hypothetical protein